MPAHRIILGLLGDEVVETRAASTEGTFAAYRRLEGAVPGMIAWPNTVLLTGTEPVIIDPGYQTQGDMLDGVLRARGIEPADIRTVVMTHLHSDHLSALPQLPGVTEVWVHRDELDTPYARRQRGIVDDAPLVVMDGAEGQVRPGLSWFHTPGHAPGHVAVVAECGQHFMRATSELAIEVALDFIAHFGLIERPLAAAGSPQQRFGLLKTCMVTTPNFRFVRPLVGFETFAEGELIATDGDAEIRALCDDCTVLMPARKPIVGREAVYLAQPLA